MSAKQQPYVEFDAELHRYFVDGRHLPSVTSILHAAGYIDDRFFTEMARWRGSEVHRLTALEDTTGIKTDLRRVPADWRGYLRAWHRYKLEANLLRFDKVEHRVVCADLGYAGTLDRSTLYCGKNENDTPYSLDDLKTTASGHIASRAGALQTAAYGHALRPGYWWPRRAICLRPNGIYRIQHYPAREFQRDLAEFVDALRRVKEQEKTK